MRKKIKALFVWMAEVKEELSKPQTPSLADLLMFINCRFLGNQDTIYTGSEGARLLFTNCYIEMCIRDRPYTFR